MKKILKITVFFIFLLALFRLGGLIADKQFLRSEIIRIHVVANSDSAEDQRIKMCVKDAVTQYLWSKLDVQQSIHEARATVEQEIPTLERVAHQALAAVGSKDNIQITFMEEEFPRRDYETFSLPAGIYQSLRIKIGAAEGKNWWCVAFPTLCVPTVSNEFQAVAVEAGFSNGLSNTLIEEEGYEIRFFLLDWLGKIENFFADFKK